MNMHFPEIKPNFWSRDVDVFWGVQESFLKKLSNKSHISIESLQKMTLQSYTGSLWEQIRIDTRNGLITSIKNRGRSSQNKGLRFCPKCLEEDCEPYFRKSWRLSFITICEKHQCLLKDCCHICEKPITPYKVKYIDDFCKCHICGIHLFKNINVIRVSKNSYATRAQKHITHILKTGIFWHQKNAYLSLAYFPALKQLSKITYHRLSKKLKQTKKALYVEDAPISHQKIIYSLSALLLSNKNKMESFQKINKIGLNDLKKDMEYIPFWFYKFTM